MIDFSEDQRAALAELVTIGVGRAASSLNDMIQQHIVLSVPTIDLVEPAGVSKILSWCPDEIAQVTQGFKGNIAGSASLLFLPDSANILVALMLDLDVSDPDAGTEIEIERDAVLTEIGNVLINGVLGSIANGIGLELDYRLPEYRQISVEALHSDVKQQGQDITVLAVTVSFEVSNTAVEGHVLLIFDVGSLPRLQDSLERLMAD